VADHVDAAVSEEVGMDLPAVDQPRYEITTEVVARTCLGGIARHFFAKKGLVEHINAYAYEEARDFFTL
jgi:hypothetical protein